MRWSAATLATLLALGAMGCDDLGNPPLRRGETPWVEWSNGPDRLQTHSATVPEAEEASLLEDIPAGGLHHRDGRTAEVATLVTVRPVWGRQVVPAVVPLATDFQMSDGTVIRRTWRAPAGASVWRALFHLPGLPRAVATRFAP